MAAISAMAWATGWGLRSTKHRCSDRAGRVHSGTGFLSRSSLGSTCPARAESGSRTPSWSVLPARQRDRRRYSPRPPRNCSCSDLGTAVPDARRRYTHVATTNDLKNGMTLNLDGALWSVVDFQHVKPGKGGAFVRTKLKNVLSGKVVDKTFN